MNAAEERKALLNLIEERLEEVGVSLKDLRAWFSEEQMQEACEKAFYERYMCFPASLKDFKKFLSETIGGSSGLLFKSWLRRFLLAGSFTCPSCGRVTQGVARMCHERFVEFEKETRCALCGISFSV